MLLNLHLHQPFFPFLQRSGRLANGAANAAQRIGDGHDMARHLAVSEQVAHFHRPDAQDFQRADLDDLLLHHLHRPRPSLAIGQRARLPSGGQAREVEHRRQIVQVGFAQGVPACVDQASTEGDGGHLQ